MPKCLQQGNVFAVACPARQLLQHITSKWGCLVLVALSDGERHRFSDLRRYIGGVSEKMLAQTLQQLVEDGFVMRYAYPVVPPKVEYTLTSFGCGAAAKLADLADWIETHLDDV